MITDYQKFTNKNTSIKKRGELHVGDIWSNSIQCLKCKDIIRSKNRHHMPFCKCKNVAIDGGSWYIKVLANDLNKVKYLTENYNHI